MAHHSPAPPTKRHELAACTGTTPATGRWHPLGHSSMGCVTPERELRNRLAPAAALRRDPAGASLARICPQAARRHGVEIQLVQEAVRVGGGGDRPAQPCASGGLTPYVCHSFFLLPEF